MKCDVNLTLGFKKKLKVYISAILALTSMDLPNPSRVQDVTQGQFFRGV